MLGGDWWLAIKKSTNYIICLINKVDFLNFQSIIQYTWYSIKFKFVSENFILKDKALLNKHDSIYEGTQTPASWYKGWLECPLANMNKEDNIKEIKSANFFSSFLLNLLK